MNPIGVFIWLMTLASIAIAAIIALGNFLQEQRLNNGWLWRLRNKLMERWHG